MESSKSFEEKFMRICEVAQTDKDAVLAKILNIKAPSVAAARKRHQIPTGWVEKIALKFNVSADWIFFGRGPMRISDLMAQENLAKRESEDDEKGQAAALVDRLDAKLEQELELEREERRELAAETRSLYREKEQLLREKEELLRENSALREQLARLETASAEKSPQQRAAMAGDGVLDIRSAVETLPDCAEKRAIASKK